MDQGLYPMPAGLIYHKNFTYSENFTNGFVSLKLFSNINHRMQKDFLSKTVAILIQNCNNFYTNM